MAISYREALGQINQASGGKRDALITKYADKFGRTCDRIRADAEQCAHGKQSTVKSWDEFIKNAPVARTVLESVSAS